MVSNSTEKQEFQDEAPPNVRRVYIGPNDEVPEPYEVQEDEEGLEYYVPEDDYFIDYQEPAEKDDNNTMTDKQEEVTEGLTWNENVMVTDVDRDEGVATLVDTEGSSEWQEPLESVEAKLEQLEATEDHEWMYELVAGEYPSLEAEDVMEMVHDAADVDKDVSRKRRVYVDDPNEVPEQFSIQEGQQGGYFYETGQNSQTDNQSAQSEQELVETINQVVSTFGEQSARMLVDQLAQNAPQAQQMATTLADTVSLSEKREVYVGDPNAVPDGYDIQEKEGGGYFYEMGGQESAFSKTPDDTLITFRKSLMEEFKSARNVKEKLASGIADLMRKVDEELFERDDKDDPCWDGYEMAGMKEGENGEMVPNCIPKSAGDMSNEEVYTRIIENAEAEKRRVYIGDPSEAPESVNVEEGDQGGYYYETEDVPDVDVDQMPGEEFVEEVDESVMYDMTDEAAQRAIDNLNNEELTDVDRTRDEIEEQLFDVIEEEWGIDLMDYDGDEFDAVTDMTERFAQEQAEDLMDLDFGEDVYDPANEEPDGL